MFNFRKGHCVVDQGSFLLALVDDLLLEMQADGSEQTEFRVDMEMAIGQAYFCLFGYPQKKSRARHLVDHNVSMVSGY